MRVMLVFEKPDKSNFYPNVLPPLGILYLSSMCEKNSIDHEVYDYYVSKPYKGDYSEFDVVGLSLNNSNAKASIELAKQIRKKKTNIVIVAGGPFATAYPESLLDSETVFDLVFIGEAEYSFIDFLKKKPLDQIPGIAYLLNGKINKNECEFIEDLDALPFPNFKRVDLKKYHIAIRKNDKVCSIISSRGCPFKCTYCFHNMGYTFRARSAENVLAEIDYLYTELGIRDICIEDDNFTLDIERAEKIAHGIIDKKYKLGIQFHNAVRIEKLTKENLTLFKKAGLWLIAVAPESANVSTLKKVRKGLDLDKLFQVVDWCRELDLFVYACFMIGFPWEKMDEVNNTLDLALNIKSHISQISRVTAFPKTELYEDVSKFSKIDNDRGTSIFFGCQNFENKYIDDAAIDKMIKKVNYKKYTNLKNLWEIYNFIGIKGIFDLAKFGLLSKNL